MTGISEYRPRVPLPHGLSAEAMPQCFGDPDAEVAACQSSAALFDYSFLIRIAVRGPDAALAVAAFCGRDVRDLEEGDIRYALHADADGHLLSDLTIWRIASDTVEVMTGRAADVAALRAALTSYDAHAWDLSADTACLAVQGPDCDAVVAKVLDGGKAVADIPYFRYRDLVLDDHACRVGRLGFTGLPGIEIICSVRAATHLWGALAVDVQPAGFLAADRLRLTAGLALFTQDFNPPISAADAGYGHLRPLADTPADCRSPQAVRVGFTASFSEHSANNVDLSSIVWSPAAPFPPLPGMIAITSVAPLADLGQVIGMGYVSHDQANGMLSDPAAVLSDIAVTQCGRADAK